MEPVLTEARRLPEERRLRLTWSDGHVAEYPYDVPARLVPLRRLPGSLRPEDRLPPPGQPVTAESVQPVGNYAISIAFSDGHGTGIYRYDFLREICPCPSCGGAPGPVET